MKPPSFVRTLTAAEQQPLQAGLRSADAFTVRRCQILLQSAKGQKAYNGQAKREGGVRILACYLPVKSPWLNAIEPKWVHGKKGIAEPQRKLTAQEVKDRVHSYYGCEQLEPLKQKVA